MRERKRSETGSGARTAGRKKTAVTVASGFLGAGKTTLLEAYLKTIEDPSRLLLIENDFGATSFDAAYLEHYQIEVRELTQGCICCSLTGDFKRSLLAVGERYRPQRILIEPSGVARLSDVLSAFADPEVAEYFERPYCITLIDAGQFRNYWENFGDFYEDQIEHAQIRILTRFFALPEKEQTFINDAIGSLNVNGINLYRDVRELNPKMIRSLIEGELTIDSVESGQLYPSDGRMVESDLSAAECFTTKQVAFKRGVSPALLKVWLRQQEQRYGNRLVRAKGFVPALGGGLIQVQYVPGQLDLAEISDERGREAGKLQLILLKEQANRGS